MDFRGFGPDAGLSELIGRSSEWTSLHAGPSVDNRKPA